MVVQQLVGILVLLKEEIDVRPSAAPSWTGRPISYLIKSFYFVEKKIETQED